MRAGCWHVSGRHVLKAGMSGATMAVLYLFGGSLMPVYSLRLAHANDNAPCNLLESGRNGPA